MFDINVTFLCLPMTVCFRTVPILQHYMVWQPQKCFPNSMDVSEDLDTFFNNVSVTLLFKFRFGCISFPYFIFYL